MEACRERASRYAKMLLVSRPYLLADWMDFEEMAAALKDFQERTRALGRGLREASGRESAQENTQGNVQNTVQNTASKKAAPLVMTNESCARCGTCTYPDAPCRFPDELQPSLEGFGYLVPELAKQAGIPYMNGPSTVTFFGAVLYDEKQ